MARARVVFVLATFLVTAAAANAAGVSRRPHDGNGDAVLRVVLPPQAILANDAVSFAIYDGTEPVNESDGWVGDSSCRVSGRSARCP